MTPEYYCPQCERLSFCSAIGWNPATCTLTRFTTYDYRVQGSKRDLDQATANQRLYGPLLPNPTEVHVDHESFLCKMRTQLTGPHQPSGIYS